VAARSAPDSSPSGIILETLGNMTARLVGTMQDTVFKYSAHTVLYVEYRSRLICDGKHESKFSAKCSTRTRMTEAGGLPWKFQGTRKGGVFCNLWEVWGPGSCCLPRPPHRADLLATCQLKGTSLAVEIRERERLENKRPYDRSSGEEVCQHRARKGRSVANVLHEEAHVDRFAAHIFFWDGDLKLSNVVIVQDTRGAQSPFLQAMDWRDVCKSPGVVSGCRCRMGG
jgi:hypothetical protein